MRLIYLCDRENHRRIQEPFRVLLREGRASVRAAATQLPKPQAAREYYLPKFLGSFLHFDYGSHDHGFGTQFFLDETFKMNAKVFLKKTSIQDMLAFHVADRVYDGFSRLIRKTV